MCVMCNYVSNVSNVCMLTHVKREEVAVSPISLVTLAVVPSHFQDEYLIEHSA